MHQPQNEQDEPIAEAGAVIEQLERILASRDFDASRRCRVLLRFLLEETLAGRPEALTEVAIATRVFGRGMGHDPGLDPIVRIQAGRLRRSLDRYYRRSRPEDAVRIELPRGTYVPVARRVGEEVGALPAQ